MENKEAGEIMVKTFSGRRKELVAILNGVASGRPTPGEAPAVGSCGGKRVGRPWESLSLVVVLSTA